jgi:hypothetical protein
MNAKMINCMSSIYEDVKEEPGKTSVICGEQEDDTPYYFMMCQVLQL